MADRPNVLLLYSDEHRADMLGCAGSPDARTPNLDALAESGVRFSEHFCTYPVCAPSRMSLLTGQWPATHLARSNRSSASLRAPSLPRLLRDAGYRTGCVGKMHFTPTRKDFGFDVMRLAEQDGDGRYEDDYHKMLAEAGRIDLLDLMDQRAEFRSHAPEEYWETFGAMVSDLPEELHSTTWIGDEAVRFLEGASEPWFLWVGFIKPHHPFDPPEAWLEGFDPEKLTLPSDWMRPIPERDAPIRRYFDMSELDEAKYRRVLAHYLATIAQMDHHIGRILEAARAQGPTVVVYTADHGDLMGHHGCILKGGYPYDPVLRVPLILNGLEGARAGATCSALSQTMDLTATLLDAAGVPAPQAMQGKSLSPLLRGETTSPAATYVPHGMLAGGSLTAPTLQAPRLPRVTDERRAARPKGALSPRPAGPDEQPLRDAVFAEFASMRTIRTARAKLIVGPDEGLPLLFDLVADPHELRNVWDEPSYRKTREDLLLRLNRWLIESHAAPPHTD